MSTEPTWIVDSDVFITAKDRYYPFDICPGFWQSIIHHHGRDRLLSIDKVRQELFNWSEEELVRWIKNELPSDFFVDTSDKPVLDAFRDVMLWVQQSNQYFERAKADFATKADGWLVAYAMVHGVRIATNEQSHPESRREVKLGDACIRFGVQYDDTFAVLRALKVRYEFRG